MNEPFDEKAVFNSARCLASREERMAYLERACAQNPEALQRILALLRVYDQEKSFLESPAADLPSPPGNGGRGVGEVGATADEVIAERPGSAIGPYKLLQQIGEGGFGVVFLAEQTRPVQRKVALKIIKPGMDTRQVIARFEAERQALALMDHPNISKVFDAGATESGRPYFVMELVKGVPITEYCDAHNLTPRERLELFIPICQAVQHAHQKGIIHRDLKPSNVMVALYDGRPVPKVIDFGVAKAMGQKLTDRTMFTGHGQIVGTLEYISPEQAQLNQLDIDTRSDIYSLGVLLYQLLTGTTPLERKRLRQTAFDEMLRIIREEEPAKPSARLSTVDGLPSIAAHRHTEPKKLTALLRGELDWIVMKALEKDRSRRYETANGFAMDVQRYLTDEPVLACPPSAWYRFRKLARRHKAALATTLLVISALAVSFVVLAASNVMIGRERDQKSQALRDKETALKNETAALGKAKYQEGLARQNAAEAKKQQGIAEDEAKRAQEQKALAKQQEALARRRFYDAQMNLAQQALEAGQTARALELLESQRPKFDEEDLRGFDWYYLWRLCHRNLHRSLSAPKGEVVYTVAIAPDGKTLVSGGDHASVRVWDVATGKERAVLTGHEARIWRLAISPDGKMVASGSVDGTVKLWDLDTSELLATLTAGAQGRSVAFSPDGNVLAVGTEQGVLELWDVKSRQRRLTLPAHPAPVIALAYSPDGKMLATGAGWDTSRGVAVGVKVWDATSEPLRIVCQAPTYSLCVAFSPDSKLLATCHGGSTKVWSMPGGQSKATVAAPHIESAAFSADGNTLVLGCQDRTAKLWEFASGAMRTVGVHLGAVNAVAFVPQSDLVASAGNDGTVKLWHTVIPQDAVSFNHNCAIRSLVFTPDSKLLVVGSDQATKVLDATTGTQTATLPAEGVLAISADANLLAASAPDHKRVIWEVGAARERAVLPVGPKLSGAAFSGDGKTLATWIWDAEVPESAVRLWDLGTSRVRLTLKKNVHCAALSPDGGTIAAGEQHGTVTLWDATTGRQRMTLQQGEAAHIGNLAVAFSGNGKMVAAGSSEGVLRLWNVETGQLKVSFKGHTDAIRSLAFSPDDRTLLSGSADRTARLWDVVTGQELLALRDHKFPVHLVAFAPDGKRLATASDNEVKLWLAATDPEATAFRVDLDPDDPNSPRAANNFGERLQEAQRPEEAGNAYRKALARLEELAALEGTPDYQAELAYCLFATSLLTDPSSAGQAQIEAIWRTLPADRQFRLGLRFGDQAIRLRVAGRFPEAIKILEQLTTLMPGEAWVWRRLGYTHEKAGQPDEAMAAYSRAIDVDPENATSWNNRGVDYVRAGHLDLAIADFRRAAQLDASSSVIQFNLGDVLRRQGKRDDAIAAYRRALEALGPNDPQATNLQVWVAKAYQSLGNVREAIQLYEQVRDQQVRTLGPSHAETLATMNALAGAYWRNTQLDRSIPLFEDILQHNEATLGRDQPETRTAMANLGVNYRDAGMLPEALALLEEVLQWARSQPPAVAGRFAWVSSEIGRLHELAQNFAKADALYREVLQRVEKQFGVGDVRTAGPLANICRNLLLQHKHADAEPLVRECLAMREKAEPDAWTTFNTRSMLGSCLLFDKKYADAEPLLLQGYEGMKERQAKIPLVGKPHLTDAIERLVQLYDDWDKPDEAAKWRKELEESVKEAASDPLPWIVRGRCYAKRGDHEKARAQFAQALKLDPEHPLCRLERAKQNRTVLATWDFSKGAEGWRAYVNNCNLSTGNGLLTIDTTGGDSYFGTPDVKAGPGRKELTICARFQGTQASQVYWSTTQSHFSDDKCVNFVMEGDGEWREYRVQFDTRPDLNALRFDPADKAGVHMELAWIMLAEHSDEAEQALQLGPVHALTERDEQRREFSAEWHDWIICSFLRREAEELMKKESSVRNQESETRSK